MEEVRGAVQNLWVSSNGKDCRDAQPGALVIGRQGLNHNTLVYQHRLCYTSPLYCTGALSRSVIYSVDQSQEPVAHPYLIVRHLRELVRERAVPRRRLDVEVQVDNLKPEL